MSIMSPYAWNRYRNRYPQQMNSNPNPMGMNPMGQQMNPIGMSSYNHMSEVGQMNNRSTFGSLRPSSIVNQPIRKKTIFG